MKRIAARSTVAPCLFTAFSFFVAAPGSVLASIWAADGYTITRFMVLETVNPPSDLEIDASGNFFSPTQPDGVRRLTPSQEQSIWSTAPAVDLALFPTGEALGAGGGICSCLLLILTDGSYVPFASGYYWSHVALDPNSGIAFMSVWAGGQALHEGLYVFDPNSGPMPIVRGGPGPSGAGWYGGMAFAPDGMLYTLGNDGSVNGLFRLNADSTLTRVAQLSQNSFSLASDPSGIFYASTGNEIVSINPVSGEVTPIGRGFQGVAYLAINPTDSRLYAADGDRYLYVISKMTPVQPISWGKLKTRYP